jgi:Phosphotransferase enzyme family
MRNHAIPRSEDDPLRQEDSQEEPECHIDLLNRCIKVAPYLEPPRHCASPTLWHEDLSLQNIMVSDDDDPQIVGLLDWQNTSIGPLHLQFCEPTFLETNFLLPGDEPSQFYQRPLLEHDIQLGEESKRLHQRYLESLNAAFPLHSILSEVPYSDLQRMLIRDSGRSWTRRNGILSLRQGLINFWRNWTKLGLAGVPPISFTKAEIATHLKEGDGRNGNLDFICYILDSIGMSQNGEVKAEEFEEKKRVYEEVKLRWIAEMNERVAAAGGGEEIQWELYWPFRYPQFGF